MMRERVKGKARKKPANPSPFIDQRRRRRRRPAPASSARSEADRRQPTRIPSGRVFPSKTKPRKVESRASKLTRKIKLQIPFLQQSKSREYWSNKEERSEDRESKSIGCLRKDVRWRRLGWRRRGPVSSLVVLSSSLVASPSTSSLKATVNACAAGSFRPPFSTRTRKNVLIGVNVVLCKCVPSLSPSTRTPEQRYVQQTPFLIGDLIAQRSLYSPICDLCGYYDPSENCTRCYCIFKPLAFVFHLLLSTIEILLWSSVLPNFNENRFGRFKKDPSSNDILRSRYYIRKLIITPHAYRKNVARLFFCAHYVFLQGKNKKRAKTATWFDGEKSTDPIETKIHEMKILKHSDPMKRNAIWIQTKDCRNLQLTYRFMIPVSGVLTFDGLTLSDICESCLIIFYSVYSVMTKIDAIFPFYTISACALRCFIIGLILFEFKGYKWLPQAQLFLSHSLKKLELECRKDSVDQIYVNKDARTSSTKYDPRIKCSAICSLECDRSIRKQSIVWTSESVPWLFVCKIPYLCFLNTFFDILYVNLFALDRLSSCDPCYVWCAFSRWHGLLLPALLRRTSGTIICGR